jgi:multidrug efflux system membrane fusion protein
MVGLAVAAVPLTGMVLDAGASSESTSTTTQSTIATATASRGDMTTDYEFDGHVDYGDAWNIPITAEGVVTQSSDQGATIQFGETLITIGRQPVVLSDGDVPMYRDLYRTSPRMSGPDVSQLQRFLLDQGFDDDGRLEVDGVFGYSTERAVEDWQEALGLEETSRVDQSVIVFSPVPLRISSESKVGAAFTGLEVTEAVPLVTVDTNSLDRSGLPVGDEVTVELADGSTMPGVITDQARKILEDGSTVWRTYIELDDDPPPDTSAVLVQSTVVAAEDVLHVPVSALLALAEGGYAVEKVTSDGTELVGVEVGEVVGGLAEVSGDIAVGDEVVVAE